MEEQVTEERDPQGLRRELADSTQLKGYMEELRSRLPAFTRRAAAVEPEAPGSVEWLGRIGKFWWKAREDRELTRDEVAERSGTRLNEIMFLEAGLLTPQELKPDFLRGYAEALGDAELFAQFQEQFPQKA